MDQSLFLQTLPDGTVTYRMLADYDCGPSASTFAGINAESLTNIPVNYEKVLENWDGEFDNKFDDNFVDSPWHHWCLFEKIGIKISLVYCEKILRGEAKNNRTVILIHDEKEPLLNQHWVVLHSVSVENQMIRLHYGNGKIWAIDFDKFRRMYKAGSPACAYIVGEGNLKVRWYHKLYVKIMDFLF
jgi:hypothetical protein